MKKSTISLAVAATVATSAAVHAGQYVNPGKTGQVLLFPFYNADNGNSTGIHITNTTDSVKAVKVRFLEYKNSDAVLDFNLYMSPKVSLPSLLSPTPMAMARPLLQVTLAVLFQPLEHPMVISQVRPPKMLMAPRHAFSHSLTTSSRAMQIPLLSVA